MCPPFCFSSPRAEENLRVGLWRRHRGRLALVSSFGRAAVLLHALRGPEAQRDRPGGVRGVLAEEQQFEAALFLLHTGRLLHGPAVSSQHILLRHYHLPQTLLGARGAVQEPAAVESKEKEDLLSSRRLRAGVRPVLAAPAGESFPIEPDATRAALSQRALAATRR